MGQYLYERFDADQVKAYVAAYVKIKADWAVNEIGKPSLPPAGQVPYRAASPDHFTASSSGRPFPPRPPSTRTPAAGFRIP